MLTHERNEYKRNIKFKLFMSDMAQFFYLDILYFVVDEVTGQTDYKI